MATKQRVQTLPQLQALHLEALQQFAMTLRKLSVDSRTVSVAERDRLALLSCSEQLDKDYVDAVRKFSVTVKSYRPKVRLRLVK